MRSTFYISTVALILSSACSGEGQDQGAGETEGSQCILQPGEYQVEYSVVSDTCDIGPLATELLVVADNGQAIGNPQPPQGCSDEVVFNYGCQIGISRTCEIRSEDFDLNIAVDFVYDFDRGTGNVRIDALAYYASTDVIGQACQTTQRAHISAID
jgi:hypothetical protein